MVHKQARPYPITTSLVSPPHYYIIPFQGAWSTSLCLLQPVWLSRLLTPGHWHLHRLSTHNSGAVLKSHTYARDASRVLSNSNGNISMPVYYVYSSGNTTAWTFSQMATALWET